MLTMLVPRERIPGERRVAATPETIRRLTAKGLGFQVEQGAGAAAGFLDEDFAEAGATLVKGPYVAETFPVTVEGSYVVVEV